MPDPYQSITIATGFYIDAISPTFEKELSKEQKEAIKEVWREEKAKLGKRLFNGKIFRVITANEERVIGEFIEYKTYLAARQGVLFAQPIYPLSVSGITICGEKILMGRRSSHVVHYPGYYEFVPSGGVDPSAMENGSRVDVKRTFERELEEETGISRRKIMGIMPFSLLFDEHVYEVIAEIKVGCEEIHAGEEYAHLFWVTPRDLIAFQCRSGTDIVPMTRFLIEKFALASYT